MRILIVPDKFKGTLTAHQAARAIARGWRSARPKDSLDLLPMSDGGDGFGEVLSTLLGAKHRNLLHRTSTPPTNPAASPGPGTPRRKPQRLVESAKVNGLALMRPKKLHPFQLDTFGLGKILRTVERHKARECLVGIGGSATNDGGFGLARSLGWRFVDKAGSELHQWWQLRNLAQIHAPANPLKLQMTVAVDVKNPLLGPQGCSRIYGPQKGLREIAFAEKCLARMASLLKTGHNINCANTPGAGGSSGGASVSA